MPGYGKEGLPLQYDMFTGDLVDNRTSAQKQVTRQQEKPQQTEMFSQRDLAQFGVKARPQMSLSPHTRLVLVAEDPRTEEEKERDREHEAQKLTKHLFSEEVEAEQTIPEPAEPILSVEAAFSPPDLREELPQIEEDEEEGNSFPDVFTSQPLSKEDAYRELVNLSEDQAKTIYSSPVFALSQKIEVSLALHEAKRAGLNETEIGAAIIIGEFRGSIQKRQVGECKPLRKPTAPVLSDYSIIWAYEGQRLEPSKI